MKKTFNRFDIVRHKNWNQPGACSQVPGTPTYAVVRLENVKRGDFAAFGESHFPTTKMYEKIELNDVKGAAWKKHIKSILDKQEARYKPFFSKEDFDEFLNL